MVPERMKKEKRNIIWLLLFPILAALTIWAISSSSRSFSWGSFRIYLRQVSPGWLAAALTAMVVYIVTEGLSLRFICNRLGEASHPGNCVSWAAADVFFSAITPSATGGQPAAAVLMHRHGIPAATCTVALLLNLIFYTLTIVVISPLTMALCPAVFTGFGTLSQVLIGVGFLIQLVLAAFFILLLRGRLIWRMLDWCLRALHHLRLVRNKEKWQQRIQKKMEDYHICVGAVSGDKSLLCGVFLLNLLQRLSQMLIPVFIYLGTGGAASLAPQAFATQACVVLGSYIIPLPGGMGVADYLFLDGYAGLAPDTVSMELLSRGISFYGCFLLSGAIILTGRILSGIRKSRRP